MRRKKLGKIIDDDGVSLRTDHCETPDPTATSIELIYLQQMIESKSFRKNLIQLSMFPFIP